MTSSDGYRKTKLTMGFKVKFCDKIDKKAQKKEQFEEIIPTMLMEAGVG